MKYKKLLSDKQNILLLMQRLGLVGEVVQVKKINHHPNYDFSEYKGPESQMYFFEDEQSIPSDLFSIYRAEIIKTLILHYDHIRELSISLDLDVDLDEDSEWILAQAVARDVNLVYEIGMGSISQFALQQLKIIEIDNVDRCVRLIGSFKGDSYSIVPYDWALYAVIRFLGFKEDFNEGEFYRQLLVESYQLWRKGDHRVAFFLAYSALEGFINRKLEAETEADRLSEKVRDLFRQGFPTVDLSKHQIYTHAINDFNKTLTSLRNGVAHGRLIAIGDDQCQHMLFVTLVLICSIEFHVESFKELFSQPL